MTDGAALVDSLRQGVAILAVAMIVAIAARRLRLPYTVGLVLVGAVLALSRIDFAPHLTHELIFDLLLPPLLFEAALMLHWRELRRDLLPIGVLATLGSAISAAVVTAGMTTLLGWPLPSALVFGTLIAATDPVAIIAMFKDNGVKGRLRLLVESESLLNDGAAAVMFVMAVAYAQSGGAAQSAGDVALTLAKIVLGGVGVGAACGGAAILAAGATTEHLVEATLTSIAAYASFLVAEHFGVSGVLATVTAGLMMGNLGLLGPDRKSYLSFKGRDFIGGLWEFLAFVANSAVFLLIGLDVAQTPFEATGVRVVVVAILLALFARALTVYPLSLLFAGSRWAMTLGERHVLWWGDLRGALALALALWLPPELPMRGEIVVVTFAVVGFSIVVQGLTMPMLLRALGFMPKRRMAAPGAE